VIIEPKVTETRNVCTAISVLKMKDRFLKTGFLITAVIIFSFLLSNIMIESRPSFISEQSYLASKTERIKELIQEGKLSDKEALFYKKLPHK
jgi:hypothetical protein